MEGKLSRNMARCVIILMVLGLAVILVFHRYVLGLAAGALLFGVAMLLRWWKLRCPNCGKTMAPPQWKKNASCVCGECGRYYEYDK